MTKENITKVAFNIYDGNRSDIPSVYVEKVKSETFGYGDCFGYDGESFWLDLNQDLDDYEGERVSSKHKVWYGIIRDAVEDNF